MNANDLLEMFPGEIESRLQAGNDIAILPIGSLEQHGPHLLLATDSFCAQAVAQEIGNCSGGTVLPPVPYSWVGCTNVFAGGIGVRESVFIDYLRAVVKRLWQSGFRRILVVNSHGGNSYCAAQFFPRPVQRGRNSRTLHLWRRGIPGSERHLTAGGRCGAEPPGGCVAIAGT